MLNVSELFRLLDDVFCPFTGPTVSTGFAANVVLNSFGSAQLFGSVGADTGADELGADELGADELGADELGADELESPAE